MGIDRNFAAQVKHSIKGMHSSSASISRKASAMRFEHRTGERQADYDTPLQALVNEEHDKDE